MTIAEITAKMIEYSKGNRHDINHFLKVYAFAKAIGECEELDETTQATLEVAALLHDIACPLCREKYGNTNGKHQEKEGPALVRDFLRRSGLSQEIVDRVAYLVGHHHTPKVSMARTTRSSSRRTTSSTPTRANTPGKTSKTLWCGSSGPRPGYEC